MSVVIGCRWSSVQADGGHRVTPINWVTRNFTPPPLDNRQAGSATDSALLVALFIFHAKGKAERLGATFLQVFKNDSMKV